MTVFNLDKHHLTTSETVFVGANATVIGRVRLGRRKRLAGSGHPRQHLGAVSDLEE